MMWISRTTFAPRIIYYSRLRRLQSHCKCPVDRGHLVWFVFFVEYISILVHSDFSFVCFVFLDINFNESVDKSVKCKSNIYENMQHRNIFFFLNRLWEYYVNIRIHIITIINNPCILYIFIYAKYVKKKKKCFINNSWKALSNIDHATPSFCTFIQN